MLNIKTHLNLVYKKKKKVVFTIVINLVVPVKCTSKSYTSLWYNYLEINPLF